MLVLTREVTQEVVIRSEVGDEVVVKLLSLDGKHAKLGFTADKHITIHRREVQDRKDNEGK